MLSGNSHGIYRVYRHTWSSDLLIKKIYNHSGFDFHLNDRATALISAMFALRKDLKSISRNDSIFLNSSQGLVLQGNVHAPVKVAMVSPQTILNFS